jgi:hypothetical protein
MRNILLIPLLGTLALLAGGCQGLPLGGGGEEETVQTTESPAATTPSPAAQGASPTPAQAGQQAPKPPIQAAKNTTVAAASGLIPSTDPKAREGQIKQGSRPDPFSVFPTRVTVKPTAGGGTTTPKAEEPQVPGRTIPDVPPLPLIPKPPRFVRPPVPPRIAQSPTPKGTQAGQRAGTKPGQASAPGRGVPAGPNFIPELPKVPQPTLAQGVKVTGVIKVGGVSHAIVEAPGQEARYVKAGDYLANGQVLVKRIETRNGAAPVVILEEKGIEVAKRVGEGGVTAASPESAPSPAAEPQQQQLNRISQG